jgi:phosphatidate cytidylyltransferase
MLSQRVKAALIFVPLVLILIFFGGWPFNLFVAAILLFATVEFSRLFGQMGYHPSLPLQLFGVLLLVFLRWFLNNTFLDALLSLLLFLTTVVALVQHETGGQKAAINFAINLSGMLYIGWVGSFLIALRALENGQGWMLTALPAVWLADCGAYFVGRRWGKRKMAPRLSPGKTWAGLIGAVITGTFSGMLLILLWRAVGLLPPSTPLWQGLVIGLLLSALTPVGDLVISLFKRAADVKDTGSLIPGHGGVLDRIDTWIWAALLGYYLVILTQGL